LHEDATKSEKQTAEDELDFAARIRDARNGSDEQLGQLIDSCRAYLLLIANEELDAALRPKVAASDLVQETLLVAQAEFPRFRGENEPALLSWLRRMLLNDLADCRRKYQHADKRAIARETPLDGDSRIDRLPIDVPASGPTPQSSSIAREEADAVQQAMSRLPKEYRQAVALRNWDRLSFQDIAKRMDRSPDAVRKLWTRAVERLRDELSATDGDTPR